MLHPLSISTVPKSINIQNLSWPLRTITESNSCNEGHSTVPPLKIVHFSDILCIWAHVSQSSLCNLIDEFGDRLEVDVRFCSVFPDSHGKIEKIWKDRGGFEGYAAHVRDVAKSFDEIDIHPDAWFKVRPKSSASPQLFVKSRELLEAGAKERPFQ